MSKTRCGAMGYNTPFILPSDPHYKPMPIFDSAKTVIGLVLAACLGGLVIWLTVPMSKPVSEIGVIESFGLSESRQGSHQVAIVRISDSTEPVRISPSHNCRVGDVISLSVHSLPIGRRVTPALVAEPCGRRA